MEGGAAVAIKLYIYSGIRSPRKSNGRIGYVAEPDGTGRILERYDINRYQAEMLALYLALQEAEMNGGTGEVDIYTDDAYISTVLGRTIPKISQTGWHRGNGKPIKNANAWKAIWEHLKGKEYRIHLNEDHSYQKWLKTNCARRDKH